MEVAATIMVVSSQEEEEEQEATESCPGDMSRREGVLTQGDRMHNPNLNT